MKQKKKPAGTFEQVRSIPCLWEQRGPGCPRCSPGTYFHVQALWSD